MQLWHVTLSYTASVEAEHADDAIREARQPLEMYESPSVRVRLFEAHAHEAPPDAPVVPTQNPHEH